ncbi:MAG: ArgE/DapE family deacylase [Candidatus Neomarinimicrobiota bacterium]|nr:ArgE/DapE family deacylase [Candidatus Neomarinimicrobiota bacterium]
MSSLLSRINDVVASLEDEIVAFVQRLVRMPSLPDQEHEVQNRLAEMLENMGAEVDLFPVRFEVLREHPAFTDDGFSPEERIDVVGFWKGGDGGRSILLNGHVDVVSQGDESLWDESPWSGTLREGRIYGRGSCDMKGGLAAGIFAVQALKRAGVSLRGDVTVQSVIGEESGGVGTLAAIQRGYTGDGAVILEPTSLQLSPIQSGALTFRLRVKGKATHAAMKWDGVSAIEKFALLQSALGEFEQKRHEEHSNNHYANPSHIAPISIGTIRGGEWHSTVPETVVAEGRFGIFPGESVMEARKALEETIAQATANDPWMSENQPSIEWFEGQFESGETPVDHPLIETLSRCHETVTGEKSTISGVTYGSDLRLFTNHANTAAVLYGPGDVRLAHAANESVEVEQIFTATKVLACMIAEWCGGDLR